MNIHINPGSRVGRWTILKLATTAGAAYWWCQCDCGTRKVVAAGNLRSGRSRSCGCWRTELLVSRFTTHGHTVGGRHSSTYNSFQAMHARCRNPRPACWLNYGGRGIRVARRWTGLRGFANFLRDLGPRPPGLTLDRRDNDAGYSPSNCRWADRHTQRVNQRPRRKTIDQPTSRISGSGVTT